MTLEQVLLAVAILIILASIWMTSELNPTRFQKDNNSDHPRSPSQNDVPGSLSADFTALIDAINNQGNTNRKEEQREERSKVFRDIINIIILGATFVALALTCGAIINQVDEMRRAYGPLKAQADNAKDTLIVSQRAWIDPLFVHLEPPTVGLPIVYRVTYQNVGHSPATGLNWAFDNGFREAEQRGSFERFDAGPNSTCDGLKPDDSGAAIEFPPPQNVSPSDYAPRFLPGRSNGPRVKNKIFADLDMINGKHFLYVQGCFIYRTMGIVGKSRFCFFFVNDRGNYHENDCGDNAAE